MAIFGRYYSLVFKNAEKNFANLPNPQVIYIRIYDMTLEGDDTIAWDIVDIQGSGTPFTTATVDNEDDKFTALKPTQATIRFLSSNQVNLSTFINAPIDPTGVDVGDPRWYVEAYLNTYDPAYFIFKGFLNLDDCYEAFLPEKNEIVLTANDGLGGLKNIPLAKPDGTNPKGYNRIADYLSWALLKTGLKLDLNAIFNIREKNDGAFHLFDKCYLHAKTFEDQIGTATNCFDVIEKIIGEEAFLFQRNGKWWIVRLDELSGNNPLYNGLYDSAGVLQSIDTGKFYDKVIQKNDDIFFSQEATTVHPLRPYKYIKETYNFSYPLEIIDNIDFSRGDLYTPLDMSPVVIDGVTYYQSKTHIADWQALEVPTGIIGGTASPSTTLNYIRHLYADSTKTVEKERYVVIEKGATAKGYYIQSNLIPVVKNDKFDISVNVRWSNDGAFPGSGFYRIAVMQVRLHGDAGTNYILNGGTSADPVPSWAVAGAGFSHVENIYVEGNTNENMSDWKTATFIGPTNSLPCPPIPVSGQIEILLTHTSFSDNTDINFNNLHFQYYPYINGGYPDYKSFYYKVSQSNNYVNKREKEVYVTSGLNPLLKGQLFRNNGTAYVLANQFFAWNDIHTTTPDDIYVHPYGHLQAFDVWNQFRNANVKFQATLQGLDGSARDQNLYSDYPSLISRLILQDTNPNTNDRLFMLLSFEMDWYSCEWKGNIVEIYNTTIGHVYSDNLETKYE